MWTSRAYDHSTLESGVKWVGGDVSTRFEKTLAKVNGKMRSMEEGTYQRMVATTPPTITVRCDVSAGSQPRYGDY